MTDYEIEQASLMDLLTAQQANPKTRIKKSTKAHKWQLKLGEPEFQQWRASRNQFILYFDGAYKGNPRVVGAGGLYMSPTYKKNRLESGSL
jgi:hypothetical protein